MSWGAVCLAVVGAAAVLSGCSGGTRSPQGSAAATTTASSATSTTTSGSTAATPRSAASTPRPPVTSARTASVGQATQPFVADTKPDVSAEREGFPVLVSVSMGDHGTYVRYVFTFENNDPNGHQPWRQFARPAWDVRYVYGSEAVHDGSGLPLVNGGSNDLLRIRFEADMHGADGHSTLRSSVSDEGPMEFGGDFEGRVSWFYGSASPRPFRVMYVGDGRVVVDIVD